MAVLGGFLFSCFEVVVCVGGFSDCRWLGGLRSYRNPGIMIFKVLMISLESQTKFTI